MAKLDRSRLTPCPRRPSKRQYGVARETARNAVRALIAEGLVYVVPGRGAYVAARD
jgi:DNA-binding GntR family transcriptional regulator